MGHPKAAKEPYEAALELARQLGDLAGQSSELQGLGGVDLERGEISRARLELDESLALAYQVQRPELIAEAAWWLAALDEREGNIPGACAGFRQALQIYKRLGNPDAEVTRRRLANLGCEPF